MLLEQRLDDRNYDGLTQSTNRKDETKRKDDVLITDVKIDLTVDADTNNDIIQDNDNNISNERIDHDIQTTYGDRNGLRIINYCDD